MALCILAAIVSEQCLDMTTDTQAARMDSTTRSRASGLQSSWIVMPGRVSGGY